MRTLLSAKDERWLLILDILSEQEWVSLSTLTSMLACSERTVRSDIKELNTIYNHIEIVSSSTWGYHLNQGASYSIDNLSADLIKDSDASQLMEALFFTPRTELMELTDNLYSSERKIRELIKEINSGFKAEDIVITYKSPEILGDEKKITSMLANRFFEFYLRQDHAFKPFYCVLDSLLDLIFEANPLFKKLFLSRRAELNLLFFIRIIREAEGYELPVPPKYLFPDEIINTDLAYPGLFQETFATLFQISPDQQLIEKLLYYNYEISYSTSYIQLAYFFEDSKYFYFLKSSIQNAVKQVADKLNLPPLSEVELTKIMLPSPFASDQRQFSFNNYEFLVEILKHEQHLYFSEHRNLSLQRLYNNHVLLELATILLTNWTGLPECLETINRTMKVGIGILTKEAYVDLFMSYCQTYLSDKIMIETVLDYGDIPNYDSLITNVTELLDIVDTTLINIASITTISMMEKIENMHKKFQLDLYLGYTK
ncbi:MAG: helix-turn-helix domain-containing protein [Carnobacterium sp.]|uniref:helix-turn-helix domain-containing protein n=1 Tax=Carnobacterium sp. TaxID=48221 RepID=UPI002FCABD73